MTLWLRFQGAAGSPTTCYRIAGHRVCCDQPLPALERWRIDTASAPAAPEANVFAPVGSSNRLPPTWIGNRRREIRCWHRGQQLRLHIQQAGDWLIDWQQLAFHRLSAAPGDPDLLAEIALGPGLILLLASCDVFCLHASGVLIADRACLFLGHSGQGKSTLAQGDTWRRIGDDILPASTEDEGTWTLPYFPQLKLPDHHQYPSQGPDRWPLGYLCLLSPAKARSDIVTATRLPLPVAARAIVAHTVASRLFPRWLLARHLVHAAHLAERVPVYRLTYPWGLDHLPSVRGRIADLRLGAAGIFPA